MIGYVKAVNISAKKGTSKKNIKSCRITNIGLEGDAHAGDWHRQVSLLAEESIQKMKNLGLNVGYGAFAENITTESIELYTLPLGSIFEINDVVLELTQIGKECHAECAIKQETGKCIMPKEGIFTRIIHPGYISVGDQIKVQLKEKVHY